jgi:disulfide bond formation protein DsbB
MSMPTKPGSSRARLILIGIVLVSLAAVLAALVSQHVFDMQPCPWCILQRLIFLTIALIGAVALLWRSLVGRIVTGSLMTLFALTGAACAVWQHFVAAKSQSCNFTLADKLISHYLKIDRVLPALFEVRATCADAAMDLFGISYDFWSLAVFLVLALSAPLYLAVAGKSQPSVMNR